MDDDEKTRRNLVVLSAGVVAYFWLALPPKVLVDRLLGTPESDMPSEIRVWILVLAVLLYLAYRFCATTADTEPWRIAKLGYIQHRNKKIEIDASAEFLRRTGKKPFRKLLQDRPASGQPSKYALFSIPPTPAALYPLDVFWAGPWDAEMRLGPVPGAAPMEISPRTYVVVRFWWRIFYSVRAGTFFLRGSHLTEYVFPVVLAAVAAALIVCRLWVVTVA